MQELHNDHLLAPDKIETKREMLYEYKWKIADLYNISIGNVKKLVPNLFDKKVRALLRQLTTLLEARIKSKKVHCILEFKQSQGLNPYTEFSTIKKNKSRDKWSQRWKSILQIKGKCCIRQNDGKSKK